MSKEVSTYLPKGQIARAGRTYVHFSGTNYLGSATDPALLSLFEEGMQQYGSYISTSRASNISFGIFSEADHYIAKWIGTEAGLVFSSGFAACQILLKILAEEQHTLCYAPGVHPANWRSEADENQKDLKTWTTQFVATYKRDPQRPLVLFYKPIDPLGLRPISMEWLRKIPEKNKLLLVLDDSHMLGLWGKRGGGIHPLLTEAGGYEHIARLMVGSLSKGMGLPAGFLAGPRTWIEKIAHAPFYLGTSMPSAAALYTLLHGEAHYTRLRSRLRLHITRFTEQLRRQKLLSQFDYLPHYPIFLCKEPQLYSYLLKKGICIAHFSYPRLKDRPRTRIVLHGAHQKEDIDRLAEEIGTFFSTQRKRSSV